MSAIKPTARVILHACGALLALALPQTSRAAEPAANTIQPRQFAAVAHNSEDNQFLLFGGTYGTTRFSDTWLLGSSGWQLQHPSTHPEERVSAALAFDSIRDEYVLFGGRVKKSAAATCNAGAVPTGLATELFCKDTWVYKKNNWTRMSPATMPPRRELHAMAFDAASGQVVMFGGVGYTSSAPLGDTWVWNGSNWKQIVTAHKPPARFLHSMAYDPVNQKVVMFGGDGGVKILNDTWLWNGSDWLPAPKQITPPDFYTAAGMAYSSTLRKMVLFSGHTWNGARSGTPSYNSWTWDGNQWKKLPLTSFELITNFSKLTASQASKAILASGTPSMLWLSR
ncbi:N-acetylneuraminic acid mutarotase [Granulicella aggregans]|uniref:N-acetylneuraminic acid mutarotase n=1 Tax=Granulicella aggregans TaxID=474949 RepID=A0A7W7ZD44_9BACT|nr:kelch repeat-containing protein [Granulicella aggregans]MBB5057374.1 N-acetylneuraminic acid mutarotase [Granulicella aggregans]